jgi:alkylhydroperoxidase/carboxymuconolactone decarboxylase family protein YurZ
MLTGIDTARSLRNAVLSNPLKLLTQTGSYWTPAWEEVLKAFPEHFAAYMDLTRASHNGPLAPKTKELIAIARVCLHVEIEGLLF